MKARGAYSNHCALKGNISVFSRDVIYTSITFLVPSAISPHPFFSVATAKYDSSENELK